MSKPTFEKEEKKKWSFANIVSIVSIFLTLVFGIYGIFFSPKYVNDAYKEKQHLANCELISDLKEVINLNTSSDSLIVPNLIKGKEIKYDIDFPYSSHEILTEVQESFISDKYIPLERRLIYYSRADTLKTKTPINFYSNVSKKTRTSFFSVFIYLLSIISLVFSVLLFLGLLKRKELQMDKELESKFVEIQDSQPSAIADYKTFERLVCEAIKKLDVKFEDLTEDFKNFPFDFLIDLDGFRIGVEVKSRLDQNSLLGIRNHFEKSNLNALFIITNKVVDFLTFSKLIDLQKNFGMSGRHIHLLTADNLEKLTSGISDLLKAEKK